MKGKRGPRDLNKKSVAELKRCLWDAFADYVKRRDTNDQGVGNCISCDAEVTYGTNECQGGHYIPKGKGGSHFLALPRFPGDELVERNVNMQCGYCNLLEGGNFLNYEKGLRDKYGDEATDELKELGATNPIQKRCKPDLIDTVLYYRNAVKEME